MSKQPETLVFTKSEKRIPRTREEILEGIMNKEVKIQNRILQPKQAEPLKLQLAILEVLLDIRDQKRGD